MKTRFLKLSCLTLILFTFFGCNDCKECENKLSNQTEELSSIKTLLSEAQSALEAHENNLSSRTQTIVLNPYKPLQSQRKLTAQEQSTYRERHFDTKGISGNSFDTKKNNGEIYLKFPVHNPPNETIEIVDVLDISSASINAIVVLLNDVGGARTMDSNTTHFLSTTIKMNSVGLNKSKLAAHKKLKVYIFHDDAFYSDQLLNDFKKCVVKMNNNYNENPCILPDPKPSIMHIKPREQEGDIIAGG